MRHFAHCHSAFGAEYLAFDNLFAFHFGTFVKCLEPFAVVGRVDEWQKFFKHFASIAMDCSIGFDIFVKFRLVNVDMYDFGLRSIFRSVAGYTVVKSHTYRNNHVTTICVDIRTNIAMHTEHTFV